MEPFCSHPIWFRRDVHYHGVSQLVDLYEWANGTKGVWMSELGYLTFPAYLPNVYLRYLYYATSHGRWKQGDEFVLIWYASWGAGPDAQKCLSFSNSSGEQLSTHGQHIALMSKVFRNDTIAAFDHFATVPVLSAQLDEESSAAVGFRLGDGGSRGIVFALLLGNGTWTGPDMGVMIVFEPPPTLVSSVLKCNMTVAPCGNVHPLKPTQLRTATGKVQIELTVPVGKSLPAVARGFGGPKDPFAVSVSYVTCE